MTNMELLNFNFVDRTDERTTFRNFFNNKLNVNILTIIGQKNVGKNYLIDRIIEKNNNNTFLVIDFNDLDNKSTLYTLLEKLDLVANGEFLKFIKDNYFELLKVSAGIVASISSIATSNAAEIFNNMINANIVLNNIKQEQESSINVICKYITEISKKENLIIVLKNFSKCDEFSIKSINNIILKTVKDKKTEVKYIVSIDEDDFNNNKNDAYSFFTYEVPIYPITLKQFTNPELFYEMLFDIFDFTPEDMNSLYHLFNICNGYPGELRDFVSKLYYANRDHILNSYVGEAKWNSSIVSQLLNKDNAYINIDNAYSRLIILLVLFLDIDCTYDLFVNITKFISEKTHMAIDNGSINAIEKQLKKLIFEEGIIAITNTFPELIVLNPNNSKQALRNELIKDNMLPLVSRYVYEYLRDNKENLKIDNKYYHQIAWHSYNSQYPLWEDINFNVGKQFYEDSLVSEAFIIFIRIKPFWKNLSLENKFILMKCFYEYGKYKEAEQVIECINTEICDFQQLMLISKVHNINMKKTESINILNHMLNVFHTDFEQMNILDMKQRILSNIESERVNAKIIFDQLLDRYKKQKHGKAYFDFLISSMEYYRDNTVQTNFDILEKIYLKNNNQLMLAELDVNRGFDFFWQGSIENAKEKFKSSIEVFERLRIHEMSYALNNYANCLMMEGDFEGAITCIRRALMFNESDYTEKTLKTHLMVCYAIINNPNYIRLFGELEQYIIENKQNRLDISLYLKITYALGFVQEIAGNENNNNALFKNSNDYTSESIQIANIYDPTTLPYLWFKDWRNDVEKDIRKRIDERYQDFYNYRFEPWLLTITHD
ncbi:MAG: tetratricopeptide repeat protein [Eubacterium sp.]|nr:tetratricopeptide repeat protein [Eubacterium sp.]